MASAINIADTHACSARFSENFLATREAVKSRLRCYDFPIMDWMKRASCTGPCCIKPIAYAESDYDDNASEYDTFEIIDEIISEMNANGTVPGSSAEHPIDLTTAQE